MGDVMYKETEIIKEGTPETLSAPGHSARQRASTRFSWWITIGVTLLLTITLVVTLWGVTDRGAMAKSTSTTDDSTNAPGATAKSTGTTDGSTNAPLECPKSTWISCRS